MLCMLFKTNMLDVFQGKKMVWIPGNIKKDYFTVERPKGNKVILTKIKCLLGHLTVTFIS